MVIEKAITKITDEEFDFFGTEEWGLEFLQNSPNDI